MLVNMSAETESAHVVFRGGCMEVFARAGDVHPIFSAHLDHVELRAVVQKAMARSHERVDGTRGG